MSNFWATWKLRIMAGAAIIAALAIAIWAAHLIGYTKGKNISRVEIERYEKEVANKQVQVVTKIVKGDDRIVTKYIETVRYQDRIVYQNSDIIKTVVVDRPVDQSVSNGWVYAHNQSVATQPIDPTLAADAKPSGIPDSQILLGVTDNYAKANQCAAQLLSLQELIRQREKTIEEFNKDYSSFIRARRM